MYGIPALLINTLIVVALIFSPIHGEENEARTSPADDVKIVEMLGTEVDTSLKFIDEFGKTSSLSNVLEDGKPVVVQFGYYTCPLLCGIVSDGLLRVINNSEVDLGEDFNVLSISISDYDSTENANNYGSKYRSQLRNNHDQSAWSFVIGENIATSKNTASKLASQVGFNYKYLPDSGEYGHSAVLIVLSPKGKVTRYLYGAQFEPFNFKMAIVEAKEEKERSSIERALLFCYNYDPQKKGYALHAQRAMRIGSALFLVVLLGFIWSLVKRRK